MDDFTRMCLLAAMVSQDDYAARGGSRRVTAGGSVGIVLATGYGPMRTSFEYLDSVLVNGEPCASPTAFSLSVQNMPAAILALNLGISGPCCTVCQLDNPVLPALLTASCWLEEERADTVLLGAADESTDMIGYGLQRLRAENADVAVPGQGCGVVFLVLQRPGGRVRPYAVIEEVCTGYGANHEHAGTVLLQRGEGTAPVAHASEESPTAWAADISQACQAIDGCTCPALPRLPARVLCRTAREVKPEGWVLLGRAGR